MRLSLRRTLSQRRRLRPIRVRCWLRRTGRANLPPAKGAGAGSGTLVRVVFVGARQPQRQMSKLASGAFPGVTSIDMAVYL